MKNLLRCLSICLLTIGLFACSKTQKSVNSNQFSPVKVKGNQFTIDNKAKVFKGLCLEDLGELESIGAWGEEYIRQASLWNADIVRFPVHPKHINRLGKEKYLEELTKGIQWAKKYNMYSIIDWHIIGNMKTELWQDPMYKTTMAQTLDFWSTIAKQYKDEPAVAFYELYNEPTTYNGDLGELSWENLMDIYGTMLDTIRTYDTEKIAILGGLNWAYNNSGLNDFDPQFKNVAYVAHPYPQKDEEPWDEAWDKNFGFITEKYPVFATEFGFSYEGQEGAHIPVISDEHYGEYILDYFNNKSISYTVWVFSWHWSPMLLENSSYTPIEGQGEFFHKKFMEL